MNELRWTVLDTLAVTQRNLIRLVRVPQLLVFTFIQPVLFVLMFRYVFAFRIFGEVWLLTGGGPARQTEVLATYLYRHAFRYQEFGVASAIGWLMVLATMLIAAGYLRTMYKRMLSGDA